LDERTIKANPPKKEKLFSCQLCLSSVSSHEKGISSRNKNWQKKGEKMRR